MTRFRTYAIAILLITLPDIASAEETFVTIQKVSGNRMLVVKDDAGGGGGRGRGMRGGAGGMANGQPLGRGRRGGIQRSAATNTNVLTVTVPTTAKITSAMRERRTFEFRVLGEIPGGLRSSIFQRMDEPLKARIVTKDDRITEVNVISGDTDINQSATSSSGQTVLAVKPKRPPMKKK
ncbi:MAG: hypothetical protein WBD31_26935 [Rubripirellula sp.]